MNSTIEAGQENRIIRSSINISRESVIPKVWSARATQVVRESLYKQFNLNQLKFSNLNFLSLNVLNLSLKDLNLKDMNLLSLSKSSLNLPDLNLKDFIILIRNVSSSNSSN